MPSYITLAELVAFGFFVGGLIHISGVGAGVLLVPSLIVMFQYSPAQAVGTASIFSVLFRIGSVASVLKQGNIHMPSLKTFVLFALPWTLAAAVVFSFTGKVYPNAKHGIEVTTRSLILIAAVIALVSLYSLKLKEKLKSWGLKRLAAFGGFLIGATGVGGGIVVVPALMSTGILTATQAIGTSSMIGLVLSGATSLLFGLSGAIQWPSLVWMLLGGYVSIPIANRLLKYFSQKTLIDIVAALIVVSINGLVLTWFL